MRVFCLLSRLLFVILQLPTRQSCHGRATLRHATMTLRHRAKGQSRNSVTPMPPDGAGRPSRLPACTCRHAFPRVSACIAECSYTYKIYLHITSCHIMKHRQRFLTPRFLMSLFFLIATAALAVKFYLRGDYPLGIIFAIFACYCAGAMVDHFFMPDNNDGDSRGDNRQP